MFKNSHLPRISIVTPSFNQGGFLEECIDSVLSQNYPNLEYIIMDGGSSDNSVDIIKRNAKHITYWQSKPDGGQYAAIEEGFKKTSGEIMAWLNSDDKYHRDAFYKAAYIFSLGEGIEWITGRPTFWDKQGDFSGFHDELPSYCRHDFLEGRYNQPFIQQESTFWRRSLWARAGGALRTDLEYAGDLELWLRYFRYAPLYSVATFLGGYRSHGNQKAGLYMDRYIAEAETILTDERKLTELLECVESPAPLVFDMEGYRKFLSRSEEVDDHFSLPMIAAAESSLQFMIRRIDTLQADITRQSIVSGSLCNNDAIKECAMRSHAMESSFSWRITRPLRWIGDKLNEVHLNANLFDKFLKTATRRFQLVSSAYKSFHKNTAPDEFKRVLVTPDNFDQFTYSKRNHFSVLHLQESQQAYDLDDCDLKVYQDMLAYNFVLDNFPEGARLLEIGGGDSRVISWLKDRYEFWNLDKLEGLGNGLRSLNNCDGFRLVRDYIGSFSNELPNEYFDGVFSISVLEHVPEDSASMHSICDDIQRLLRPGGLSMHCFDCLIKKNGIWKHRLLDFFYEAVPVANQRVPDAIIVNDPNLWGMSKYAYESYWRGITKLDYETFGIPFSYNLVWRKYS